MFFFLRKRNFFNGASEILRFTSVTLIVNSLEVFVAKGSLSVTFGFSFLRQIRKVYCAFSEFKLFMLVKENFLNLIPPRRIV